MLPTVCWLLVTLGIATRLMQYLFNRSLWVDEAALALNLVNRTYLELLQPLDYDQGAPIGFLWIEKLAIQTLGNHEYALRLFPLICGIATLFLFFAVAQRILPAIAIPVALAIAAGAKWLNYYSSEVKQYSSDVAIALGLFLLLTTTQPAKYRRQPGLSAGLGAIAIWFSYPAIFVLAGVEGSLLLLDVVQRRSLYLGQRAIVYGTWLLSFAAFYMLSLKNLTDNTTLSTSWQERGFPDSLVDVSWLIDNFYDLFDNPVGFDQPFTWLAVLFFVIGCVLLARSKGRSLLLLLSPLFITLVAAYLHQYPFFGRLVLFLSPFLILVIAAGLVFGLEQRSRIAFLLTGILTTLLLFQPVTHVSRLLTQPYLIRAEIKPVLHYIQAHRQPDDVIFVFTRGAYQFRYYADRYGFQPEDYRIGIADIDEIDGEAVSSQEWQRYRNDLRQLRGYPRVWIILAHAEKEREQIIELLDRWGKESDRISANQASGYLYDLRRN